MTGCCSPSREGREVPRGEAGGGSGESASHVAMAMASIPAGTFWMGTADGSGYPSDGEAPSHPVSLDDFQIGVTTVTNAEFAAFCAATGYRTLSELDGWSFVFGGLLPDDFPPTRGVVGAEWWRQVEGADWQHPEGPDSTLDGRLDHPVVHVTWDDAVAFCAWSGTRLPTEAEWERAARGGHEHRRFPWGDELEPDGEHRMNVFQGSFPGGNSGADGYLGTAPVRSFAANDFGLHEMTGNVWEWCHDWFDPNTYTEHLRAKPTGPVNGTRRVMRGGSYLCHHSYCTRYRVAARSSNTADSSAGNIGFRVVASGNGGE